MAKKPVEGEIVSSKELSSHSNKNNIDIPNLQFPGWRLLICLIPVVGLVFAIGWFYYEKNKQSIMVFYPVLGIVIGLFSTCTFLVLKFIFKAIF